MTARELPGTPEIPPISPARATREEILAHQSAKLRRVVEHAYESVPHYRALFDEAGVDPGDVRSAADLPLVPVTSRRAMQARPTGDVIARGYDVDDLSFSRTSGSTGEAFHIWRAEDQTASGRSAARGWACTSAFA